MVDNIDQDSKDVNDMVYSAKYGNWSKVHAILKHKPYLVNCIPERRSYAVLHQAACWGSRTDVDELLNYSSCDSEVQSRGGDFWPECKKASEIAANKGFLEIEVVLNKHSKEKRAKRFGGEIPTYVTAQAGVEMDKKGLPLLLLTIANYKQTLHPANIDMHETFMHLMKDIFDYTDTSNHWKKAKEKISSSISAFCKASGDELRQKSTNEKEFHTNIIRLYTRHIYRVANEALRREGQEKYKATGDDLALGPYVLMLDILLFYWKDLKSVSSTTYRGMSLSENDLKKYSVGTQFVWLSFVSSSLNRYVAEVFLGKAKNPTIFEIFNDAEDVECWRPRLISGYSAYKAEDEAVYPAGAEFEVISKRKENAITTIKLKLKNPI